MIQHNDIEQKELLKLIKSGAITLAGNRHLKIYGLLNCQSGKRMKNQNRVFFENEKEAVLSGYRPCGNCMFKAYQTWKHGAV